MFSNLVFITAFFSSLKSGLLFSNLPIIEKYSAYRTIDETLSHYPIEFPITQHQDDKFVIQSLCIEVREALNAPSDEVVEWEDWIVAVRYKETSYFQCKRVRSVFRKKEVFVIFDSSMIGRLKEPKEWKGKGGELGYIHVVNKTGVSVWAGKLVK
jgi:hypothetical protein